MDTQSDIMPAGRKAQWIALAVVLVLLTLGLMAALYVSELVSELGELAAENPELATQRMNALLKILALGLLAALTGASLLLVRVSFQTQRTGQYPPPGTPVVRAVKIVRGRKAVQRAWLGYAVAAILLASGILLAWLCLNLEDLIEAGAL